MFDAALLPGVLASAPDAIVVVDAAGNLCYANHQLTALFGYEPDEVIDRPIEMLLPSRLHQRHLAHRQDFQNSLRIRPMGVGQELLAVRKDGSEFPVEISLSPIGESGQRYVAAAIRDATERRAAERALRQARAEADRATLAKSRFLATASHDLRQPLQALTLLNGILRRMVTEAAVIEAVEQQGQSIAVMSRLLSTLLDISKLESGSVQVEITDFDLSGLLDEAADDFRIVAADKGVQLRLEGSRIRAHTDRTLLMQVVRNLVANALTYTDRGSVCLRSRSKDGAAYVDVVDTGIGISAANLDSIFDEFFQARGRTHSTRQGYGLGLSIVQRIVRLLDLDIAVTSEPGAGSTFTIRMPLGTSAPTSHDEPRQRNSHPQAHPQGNRAILLVEDDDAVRKAMQAFLRSEGYRVTAAASLAEALACSVDVPDLELVVCDYHLADARGTEVIAALRQRLGDRLASILMTGDTSSAINELPQDNRLRIISKPIDAEELLDLIHILMPTRPAAAIT